MPILDNCYGFCNFFNIFYCKSFTTDSLVFKRASRWFEILKERMLNFSSHMSVFIIFLLILSIEIFMCRIELMLFSIIVK